MGSSPIGRPSPSRAEGRVPVLILAGGAARRMGGGDKCLLALRGRPILAHLLARLRPAHDRIAISANGDPARFAAFGLDAVLPDPVPGLGPLGGLVAGLDWAHAAGAAVLLTVPGDMPFPPPDLAARLGAAPAVASSGGRAHPTVALWPVHCRARLRAVLAARGADRGAGLSLGRFADRLGAATIAFDAAGGDPFRDADTPADLAALEAAAAC